MIEHISKIDSERFGFPIAKIDRCENFLDPSFINGLKALGVRMIISRIDLKELKMINLLESIGFQLMDVQTGYQFFMKNKGKLNVREVENLIIRKPFDDDLQDLISIAHESFVDYGHYFADSRLNRNNCMKIYGDWVRRCMVDEKFADVTFIATYDSEVCGFLSLKIEKVNRQKLVFGKLGAVSESYRRRHIMESLIHRSILWMETKSLDILQFNTLNINLPINSVVIKMGFVPRTTFVTMHNWL